MSEFKGTPGPWNISRDNRSGEIVSIGPAYSEEYAGTCWIEVSQANANLIAAAPDLLECLIELRQWISQEIAHPNSPCGRADTAIAKALGEEK